MHATVPRGKSNWFSFILIFRIFLFPCTNLHQRKGEQAKHCAQNPSPPTVLCGSLGAQVAAPPAAILAAQSHLQLQSQPQMQLSSIFFTSLAFIYAYYATKPVAQIASRVIPLPRVFSYSLVWWLLLCSIGYSRIYGSAFSFILVYYLKRSDQAPQRTRWTVIKDAIGL